MQPRHRAGLIAGNYVFRFAIGHRCRATAGSAWASGPGVRGTTGPSGRARRYCQAFRHLGRAALLSGRRHSILPSHSRRLRARPLDLLLGFWPAGQRHRGRGNRGAGTTPGSTFGRHLLFIGVTGQSHRYGPFGRGFTGPPIPATGPGFNMRRNNSSLYCSILPNSFAAASLLLFGDSGVGPGQAARARAGRLWAFG